MTQKIVQFTQLGKFGRFGNQIFQYLFARAYAEKYSAILEIPAWIGEKIFKNVSHPKPSKQLPRTSLDNVPWGDVNIDLFGYYQKKECFDIIEEKKIRTWLQFQDKWVEKLEHSKNKVVAHLRRGDYITLYPTIFCTITKESYIKACDKFNIAKENIIWLSEEDHVYDPSFDRDLQFLPDFFSMITADILLRSNSTFSFWSGFFNATGKVFSPVVEGKSGTQDVEFVEGNTTSILTNNPEFIFR